METDLDIITDMFDTLYDDTIESNKEDEYYIGKAEHILQQIKNNKDYYIAGGVKSILDIKKAGTLGARGVLISTILHENKLRKIFIQKEKTSL